MEQRAFTRKTSGLPKEVRTAAGLFAVATGRAVIPDDIEKFEAIWDTGATNTAIASSVVQTVCTVPNLQAKPHIACNLTTTAFIT